MNGQRDGHDGDRAEFDRIVASLRKADRLPVHHPLGPLQPDAAVPPDRPRYDGAFVAVSLAVIMPVSVFVGGWIGLLAVIVSTVVSGLMLIEPHRAAGDDTRRAA